MSSIAEQKRRLQDSIMCSGKGRMLFGRGTDKMMWPLKKENNYFQWKEGKASCTKGRHYTGSCTTQKIVQLIAGGALECAMWPMGKIGVNQTSQWPDLALGFTVDVQSVDKSLNLELEYLGSTLITRHSWSGWPLAISPACLTLQLLHLKGHWKCSFSLAKVNGQDDSN